MRSLVQYFGCGSFQPGSGCGYFVVEKLSDPFFYFMLIKKKGNTKIIPFFDKHPLQGVKANDLSDFRKVAKIVEKKGHLTEEGLEQILSIKLGMNRGRTKW